MPEQPSESKLSPSEVWGTLNKDQRNLFFGLAVGNHQSGVAWKDLSIHGGDERTLEALVEKGVVEKGSAKTFAQEWLNARADEIREVESRLGLGEPVVLTREEQSLLADAKMKKNILSQNIDVARYRLEIDMLDFLSEDSNWESG